MLKKPVDGYISIQDYTTLHCQDEEYRKGIRVGGSVRSKISKKHEDFGQLILNNSITLNADIEKGNEYHSIAPEGVWDLFGKTIPVSLEGKGQLPGLDCNFYVPKIMTITSPPFDNYSHIAAGLEINWIPDENNNFGIGIVIEYDPWDNPYLGGEQIILKEIITEDDGSYIISSSDLEGIPHNALIDFHIGRGNYSRVQMEDDTYYVGIYCYSVVVHSFITE